MGKVAVMVDGGFYRKRASFLWGRKTAKKRADELYAYCMAHIGADIKHDNLDSDLYRIFYYDCPPIEKIVFHPLTMKNIDFSKSDTYKWTLDLFEELKKKKKACTKIGRVV